MAALYRTPHVCPSRNAKTPSLHWRVSRNSNRRRAGRRWGARSLAPRNRDLKNEKNTSSLSIGNKGDPDLSRLGEPWAWKLPETYGPPRRQRWSTSTIRRRPATQNEYSAARGKVSESEAGTDDGRSGRDTVGSPTNAVGSSAWYSWSDGRPPSGGAAIPDPRGTRRRAGKRNARPAKKRRKQTY